MNETENKRLTKKELRQIFLRYQFMVESAMSYEKMHGATWAWSYLPLGEKYYSSEPEKLQKLLIRHSYFYNTEPQTGQLVNGVVASLEEEIGMGNTIDEEVPVTVKASLMGPLAGIGDSVMQGILIPTLLSIAMGLSSGGNPMGPIFYILGYGVIATAITIVAFKSGYKLGVSAIDKIIGENAKRITNAFNTLGIIVVGGLSASTIMLETGIDIPFGEQTKPLQEILDDIFPGLFPLLMVLFAWWLISSKRYSATKVLIILAIVTTIGVVIGLF
ncbi:MAG: PTS system mannose/fructose/sorbose family transporter subunit IID [Tetragenococcus koreensis]|nr:PTS system mannose/fructose/sorbose family transporter subunit IID [Tetragenococcus koreensis]MDN6146182.1 PTS system mannose/fructose/sorbose family transporter subunit IID [Tetragenococcus koreensis]MDN6266627.1 PTS system mannose/fructose/sorbose family transporter subunit IID [Tetragenococcus koreensis]MDN6579659.1 PTS system mannose/fructose/sorbose family transporter subunit IID [Tetragenococcus koreensis]MDN6598652.1 PTS system mannose/fructose/sorbose family transporter subunit IID [